MRKGFDFEKLQSLQYVEQNKWEQFTDTNSGSSILACSLSTLVAISLMVVFSNPWLICIPVVAILPMISTGI